MDAKEVREHAARLESAPPEEILRFAFAHFDKIAISTAFGPEGCALVSMAAGIQPGVQVFTVDTDFLFPESIQLRDRFVQKYKIQLWVQKGTLTLEEQDLKHGVRLYERDTDACCALRKVEPTQRALSGLDAWIAGLRRDQSKSRAKIDPLELYERPGTTALVKVNPLVRWTRKDTWDYLLAHDVPYNPLLDRGYKSIGCAPCTKPVGANDEERAGRWGGQKAECGIHTFMARKG